MDNQEFEWTNRFTILDNPEILARRWYTLGALGSLDQRNIARQHN